MSGRAASAWVDMHQVSVRYGRVQALDHVSLRILPGERVALVGANGSGKSTLLRVLHGLADASGGGLHCDAALRQAMLFQRPHMLRTSAHNNVALALWLRGTRWRVARTAALAALQRVGLQGIAGQNARTLSGGQQQRVALARALAPKPRVLLLDEPLSALDAKVRVSLRSEIRAIQRDLGITTIFVTHDQEEAMELADLVVVMSMGRIEQIGKPQEIRARPATPFVREFITA